jgi:hypothetical protein
VGPDEALAFATFLHALGFLPLALAGLISMIREGLSWGAVQSGTRDIDRADEDVVAAPPVAAEPSSRSRL